MTDSLRRELRAAMGELPLTENEPLRLHTSFRIGGPAALYAAPRSAEELEALCRFLYAAGEEPLLLGRGTNVLITDDPLDRVVIQTSEGVGALTIEDDILTADCGVLLSRAAAAAQAAGLAGLEFAGGIPGSIGGGVSMNAGAYGGELKDVIVDAEGLTPALCAHRYTAEELELSYRHSVFSAGGTLLRARFKLHPDDPEAIAARMRTLAAKRRASQPLELPSAGSFFKRPEGHFAGALIEQAGLKGYTVGGARISEKHAGFLVTDGTASFADVIAVMEHTQKTVSDLFGVELSPEVRIIRS